MLEVIVTSSIILVLAGIVTIAVPSGLRAAKNSACMNNLRSIGQATKLYLADHDDIYPPYPFHAVQGYQPKIGEYWSALESYGVKSSVRYCPLDDHARTTFKGNWHTYLESSYSIPVWFYILDRKFNWFAVSGTAHEKPSETVYMYDQEFLVTEEDGSSSFWTGHGESTNALYLDGHTKSIRIKQK